MSGLARQFWLMNENNRYPKGIVVTDEEIEAIKIKPPKFHGEWLPNRSKQPSRSRR